MKIGILTHYNVHNHGALLQLYALKAVIESRGNEVKALTFKKNYDFMPLGADKKYDISIKSLLFYLSYLKKFGFARTIFNIKKKKILDKFREPFLGEYYSRAERLDGVFVGSDEVFSIEAGVNPYFFGIGVPAENVFSYAASCGPTKLDDIKYRKVASMVAAGLKDMKKISVRDQNTKDIVLSLTGIEATDVCDPVILYGYKEEQERLERKIKKDYLLIYAYDNNMNDPEEVEKIKDYARKNNLMIVSVGYYHKWCDKCVDGSPIDILAYFKHASCVVTDTFHGSVMSLITNTEFVTKIRKNRNKLFDLLNRYQLTNRMIEDFSEINEKVQEKIDYKKTNHLLEESRKASLAYIEMCLGEVK